MKSVAAGVILVGTLLGLARPCEAQIRVGVQGSFGDGPGESEESAAGLGARLAFPVGFTLDEENMLSRLEGHASFDYFFPDCASLDCSYWEINGNAVLPFPVAGVVAPYVGAGLSVGRFSFDSEEADLDDSETEVGVNLLGGARVGVGSVDVYGEARAVLAGAEWVVLTLGVLLGRQR